MPRSPALHRYDSVQYKDWKTIARSKVVPNLRSNFVAFCEAPLCSFTQAAYFSSWGIPLQEREAPPLRTCTPTIAKGCRLHPETWCWPFNTSSRVCPVILITVAVVGCTKCRAHPCHRLAFVVNNWFKRGSAYLFGHSTHLVKGQLSSEKISNTGAFPRLPLPRLCEFFGKLFALYIYKMDSA